MLDAAGGGGAGLPGAELVQGPKAACLTLGTAETGAGGDADGPGATGAEDTSDQGDETGGGGTAGTTSAAGTGGSAGVNMSGVFFDCQSVTGNGAAGTSGSGRVGGSASSSGGGGGGGYFGGGAGGSGAYGFLCAGILPPAPPCGGQQAASGGGGGGASYSAGAGVSNAIQSDTGNSGQVNQGAGEAVLAWADPIGTGSPFYDGDTAGQAMTVPAATGLLSADAAAGPAGDQLTASGPASGRTADGGSAAATGITAALSLPAVLTRESCGGGCTVQGNDVTWKLSRLAAGASKTFSLTVTAIAVGSGQVSAIADTGSYDPSLTDNTDTMSITVSP